MADKEEKLFLARLAEQAERYEEMVEHMKAIAKLDVGLTPDERNLLSVAYKNVIGLHRSSWRIVSNLEAKSKEDGQSEKSSLETEYRKQIEKEMEDICNDILDLLDTNLIPSAQNEGDGAAAAHVKEAFVFYYKMKGDYLRYLAEFTSGDERKDAAENSLLAYKTASDNAKRDLRSTHPIRLGLALNFSVFYYEILNSPERACKLAKKAFDDALKDLEDVKNEEYKDSTLILQLLRDNLKLWTSDAPENGTEEDPTQVEDVEDEE